MALLKLAEGKVIFAHGKYQGESLEDVAVSDPGYLQWLYKKASEDLSLEIFHKLQDVMTERGIDFP